MFFNKDGLVENHQSRRIFIHPPLNICKKKLLIKREDKDKETQLENENF